MKFFNYCYRLMWVIVYLLYKGKLFRKRIKLKTQNNSCSILGNGPSLIKQLKESNFLFEQKDVFVVNNFVLSDYYLRLKPKYYAFADPSYWHVSSRNEEYLKSRESLIKISNITDWELNIIAPISAEECFRNIFKTNANIKLHFFKAQTLNPTYQKFSYFMYSKDIICPEYQNVLISSTFLAMNIGFKEINLFGAEHSWTESIKVNSFNQVCLADKHFYELEPKLIPWKKVNGDPYKISEILIDLSKMFQGYYNILGYAKFKGVKIFNCTPNSFIDAFDRKVINNSDNL